MPLLSDGGPDGYKVGDAESFGWKPTTPLDPHGYSAVSYDPSTGTVTTSPSTSTWGTGSPTFAGGTSVSPGTPGTWGTYYPTPFLATDEQVKGSITEVMDKVKLETLQDILDDMEACKGMPDFVELVSKLQTKIRRLKGTKED